MIRYFLHRYADITLRQLVRHFIGRLARLDGNDDFSSTTRPCVFFLSTGRVGTKTIAALASLSEHVIAFHEPAPKLYGLSNICYQTFDENRNLELFKEAFLTARKDLFNYTLSFNKGYVETSPQVTFLAPIIRSVMPEAKFVHVIRDPRSFIRSGMRRRWYVDHPMDNTRIKPPLSSELCDQWQHWSPFRKIIWLWQESNLWIDKFMSTLRRDQGLFLQAEEIFELTPNSLEKLYRILNTDMPSEKKIKWILSKKFNAQTTGDFPEFSGWTDKMYTELVENTGNTAEYFGYKI